MRRLPTLEDQDEALVRLALWPYPGKSMEELSKEQRIKVYSARAKLAHILEPVPLPMVEAKKYRSADIDRLINP